MTSLLSFDRLGHPERSRGVAQAGLTYTGRSPARSPNLRVVIRGVGALPRTGVPPSRNCVVRLLRDAGDKVHSRAAPFAVQPPYHKALTSELVLFDGNSIIKVCRI